MMNDILQGLFTMPSLRELLEQLRRRLPDLVITGLRFRVAASLATVRHE